MHLPQIVADLKYRRKIAEKVFSANPRAFDQRILREKDDMMFSVDPNWTLYIRSCTSKSETKELSVTASNTKSFVVIAGSG